MGQKRCHMGRKIKKEITERGNYNCTVGGNAPRVKKLVTLCRDRYRISWTKFDSCNNE